MAIKCSAWLMRRFPARAKWSLLGKPVDDLNLSEDSAGDDRPNSVEVNEMRASALDEFLDLGADGLHLGVEGLGCPRGVARPAAAAPGRLGHRGAVLSSDCLALFALSPRWFRPV